MIESLLSLTTHFIAFVIGLMTGLLSRIGFYEYKRWREKGEVIKAKLDTQKENIKSSLSIFINLWKPITARYSKIEEKTESFEVSAAHLWLTKKKTAPIRELDAIKPELTSLSSLISSYSSQFQGKLKKDLNKVADNLREMTVLDLTQKYEIEKFVVLGHEAYVYSLKVIDELEKGGE